MTIELKPVSPFEVEVSPVHQYGMGGEGGYAVCSEEPGKAEAFGVYLRAPLAFHLRDFELAPAEYGIARYLHEQATAAFAWADALAEHIGAQVVSAMPRDFFAPAEAPAADQAEEEIPASTIGEVAAVLWEAALDWWTREPGTSEIGDAVRKRREEIGAASFRLEITSRAEECERAWLALSDDQRDDAGAFDWEFAPNWLAERMGWWTPPKVYVAKGGPVRAMVAADLCDNATTPGARDVLRISHL